MNYIHLRLHVSTFEIYFCIVLYVNQFQALHYWKGDRGFGLGPSPQARRQLHGPPGLHGVQRLRWRHRVGSRLLASGAPLGGLRQEVEDLVHRVVLPADLLGVR